MSIADFTFNLSLYTSLTMCLTEFFNEIALLKKQSEEVNDFRDFANLVI